MNSCKHSLKGLVLVSICLFIFGCQGGSGSKANEARNVSRQVKAQLDITTPEQMMEQMPQAPSSQVRQGDKRIITWSFSDGSKIVAVFKAAGGEGSGGGLVLYSVEIRN